MKTKLIVALALFGAPFLFAAEEHDHSKESKTEHADHDHDDDDHGHGKKGPNGGHVIESVTPAIEVVAGKDRKLRLIFLDKDKKAIAPGDQVITAVTGERANPVRLSFAKGTGDDEKVLVADKPLPDGAHVPVVLQIKETADAKTKIERFEMHMH